MSAMARRPQQIAVLVVAALVHAAVAENDEAGGHESADGHHGVQGHWTVRRIQPHFAEQDASSFKEFNKMCQFNFPLKDLRLNLTLNNAVRLFYSIFLLILLNKTVSVG